jgi:hypothetical protein
MKRFVLALSAVMLSAVVLGQLAGDQGPGPNTVTDKAIAYSFNPVAAHDAAIGISNRGSQAGVEFWTKGPSLYGYLRYAELTTTGMINRFDMSMLQQFICTGPDWFWGGTAMVAGYGYFNGRPSFFDMVAFDAAYGAPDMFWIKIYHLNGALLYERVVAVIDGDIRVLLGFDD